MVSCSIINSLTSTQSLPVQTEVVEIPHNYAAVTSNPALWVQLSPTGTAPSQRMEQASVYDEKDDRLIVFGGTSGTGYFNDTWVLTNASGTADTQSWIPLSTAGTAPYRFSMIFAYNSAQNMLIVFGGADNTHHIKMDLWVLTNANGLGSNTPTWKNLPISGTSPSPRCSMAGAYDEATDTFIIFGGSGGISDSTSTLYDETWTIRNVTTNPSWQKLETQGALPASRTDASAVYDPVNNSLIMFGGNMSTANLPDPSGCVNDTWVLSNANGMGGIPSWNQVNTSISPPAKSGQSAVFDSTDKRMIIFGGGGADNIVRNDVWVLTNAGETNASWVEYDTGKPTPSSRAYHTAVYTGSTKNSMVVFGGDTGGGNIANDVWELKDANGIPATPVKDVTINSASTTLFISYTLQLTAIATDVSGNEIDGVLYTWSSSNPDVATVSSTGLVKGISPGTATITVTYLDASGHLVTSQFVITIKSTPLETTPVIVSRLPTSTTSTRTTSPKRKPVNKLTIDTRWIPDGPYYTYPAEKGETGYAVAANVLMAYGGTPSDHYTWDIPPNGGHLPQGIVLSQYGVLESNNQPLKSGTYPFDVEVSDGSSTATANFTIYVGKYEYESNAQVPVLVDVTGHYPSMAPYPNFQQAGTPTIPLVGGVAGQYYAASLYVLAGKPPYTWSEDTGYTESNIGKSGLTIDPRGGIVRGTISPDMSGKTIQFKIVVKDSTGAIAETYPGPVYKIKVQ